MKMVREPVRGGKEKVLQALLANGTRYDRKLTKDGFIHAMTKNTTNVILMMQGFLTNLPWGIIFTFLNDYLSQEQGLTVPEATFLVFWFGMGSAAGGILGGYFGTLVSGNGLPLFMATSTFLGIFPFLGLLDLDLRKFPLLALVFAFSGGCIANLPSVNVRPCLLNVNPPETRAAAMTAANLMIQIARGVGPSLIILLQKLHGVTRQYSFNLSVSVFPR
jgi:translation initiation factor 4G